MVDGSITVTSKEGALTYEQLYAYHRIGLGLTDDQLDAIPLDDLEIAADRGREASRKWLTMRGFNGNTGQSGQGREAATDRTDAGTAA
jgi:hypothetical protein